MLSSAWKLAAVLQEKAPQDLKWRFEQFPDESHGSVPLQSFYQGLKAIFPGWHLAEPIQVFQQQGLAAVEQHYASLSEKYGFETVIPERTLDLIGWQLYEKRQMDEARTLFERNVEAYPGSSKAQLSLGKFCAGQEEKASAQKHLQRALELDPGDEEAQRLLREMEGGKK